MRGTQSILVRVAGPSARTPSRGLATTSAVYSPAAAVPIPATNVAGSPSRRRLLGAEKQAKREAKKKDDKLRRAVELYHLTSYFFPTPGLANASSASGNTKSESDALDDERINERIRDELSKAIDEQDSVTMRSALAVLDGERNGYLGEEIDRVGHGFLRNSRTTSRSLFDSDSDLERQRQQQQERDREEQQAELPLPADRKATAEYISKLASSRDAVLTRQKFEELNVENMRSLRVRDALFGTTGGTLPGLEVVRERIEEKRAREAQESSKD